MTDDIHEAVRSGNVFRVRDILQRYPSCVNHRTLFYKTPLHVLLDSHDNNNDNLEQVKNKLAIAQALLDHGADVNARGARCLCTPLHLAMRNNCIEVVELLLQNGADPNLRDSYNCVPLHWAARNGFHKIMELLLKNGAEINAVDCSGETPLDQAIPYKELISGAEVLINAGAKARKIFNSVEIMDEHYAHSLIGCLIHHGAKIHPYGQFSTRVLYLACLNSSFTRIETIEKILLDFGINVDGIEREVTEMTQLHIAVENKDEHLVQDLLKAGADVNAKNVLCQTPLHLLVNDYWDFEEERLCRIARLLIEAGADLYARDCYGFTPLQTAASQESYQVMNVMLAKIAGVQEILLNMAKAVKVMYDGGITFGIEYPLQVAIASGNEKMVDGLLEKQHHTQAMYSEDYKHPLFFAIKARDYRIAKMLLEADCRIDRRYFFGLPLIHCRQFNETDLKMICLFWEFNQDVVINYSLVKCVKYDCDPNFVIKLLVLCFAIGCRLQKLSTEFGSMEQFIRLRRKYSLVLDRCNDKLDELRTVKMENGLLVYDILMKPLDSLVKFVKDEDNLVACMKFSVSLESKDSLESYEHILKNRIELAIERRNMLDSAKSRLNEAIQHFLEPMGYESLPDEIVFNILDYLNVRELKKIAS